MERNKQQPNGPSSATSSRESSPLGGLPKLFMALLVLIGMSSARVMAQGYALMPSTGDGASAAARDYAVQTGNYDLVDAIDNGEVIVYFGDVAGDTAAGRPSVGGVPAEIIVDVSYADNVGPSAVHEWEHIVQGHPTLEAGANLTPDEFEAQSCAECSAICASINAAWVYFFETGRPPTCAFLKNAKRMAVATCYECGNNPWPPAPDPCGTTGLPCL